MQAVCAEALASQRLCWLHRHEVDFLMMVLKQLLMLLLMFDFKWLTNNTYCMPCLAFNKIEAGCCNSVSEMTLKVLKVKIHLLYIFSYGK